MVGISRREAMASPIVTLASGVGVPNASGLPVTSLQLGSLKSTSGPGWFFEKARAWNIAVRPIRAADFLGDHTHVDAADGWLHFRASNGSYDDLVDADMNYFWGSQGYVGPITSRRWSLFTAGSVLDCVVWKQVFEHEPTDEFTNDRAGFKVLETDGL